MNDDVHLCIILRGRGYSETEAAHHLGVHHSWVKKRLQAARREMKARNMAHLLHLYIEKYGMEWWQ